MTRYLSVDDLLVLCDELGALQIRDVGLLESAAHRPSATVFGDDAYPGLHVKAAALLQSLVRNHSLIDGNKRLSWVATYVFYAINGLRLRAPEDEAYDLVIDAATGAADIDRIAGFLESWVSSAD